MRLRDDHILPELRDGLDNLYVEWEKNDKPE